jgi:CDP-2,3-bis-(O-geranylgeranyl)-sn-glycerol synthase
MFLGNLLFDMGMVLWLTMPLFGANMLAVVTGRGGQPIDGGKCWHDGQRLLGDGKTRQGFLYAPLFAAFATHFLGFLFYSSPGTRFLSDVWIDGPFDGWIPMLGLAYGALIGDLVKSFFKRRGGASRGAAWPFWDQFDAIVGGLTICWIVCQMVGSDWFVRNLFPGRWLAVCLWLPLYYVLHRLFSRAAHRGGLKTSAA